MLAAIALLACMLPCRPATAGQADCVELAAERYGLPVSLIRVILKVEGGRVGLAGNNKNGTQDIGPMQINTVWMPLLARYGITREQLQNDRCINILAGSWILGRQFKAAMKLEGSDQRRFWWAIGAYHSRTPRHNVKYALKVWRAMQAETRIDGK
ncbi:MAG: lytic transglycosylase domain-containing protein [Candidatus Sedimenticola sp. (ex Thyasira tokunagai)]